jgi:hypothetical protein
MITQQSKELFLYIEYKRKDHVIYTVKEARKAIR